MSNPVGEQARRVPPVGGVLAAVPRRAIAAALRLPAASHAVEVVRNVRIPVETDVTLAADVYHPVGADAGPAVLIRTPYGRRGWSGAMSLFLGQRFAERGYRVVFQDVRGRFDSDGTGFAPYVYERDDAAATAEWIVSQDWSDGQIATWGSSYLGYVQWALAAADGPHPAAMVPISTSANLGGDGADGALPLDTVMRWALTVDAMDNRDLSLPTRLARIVSPGVQRRLLTPGFAHLPLSEADEVILARQSDIWRMWVANADPGNTLWEEVNHASSISRTDAAVHSVTGWYDVFLDRQIEDYERLVAAGHEPFLTVGPWHHVDPRMHMEGLRIGLDWFDAHLRGQRHRLRDHPVRIWVSGAGEWRDLPAWPPPGAPTTYRLANGGRLTHDDVASSARPDEDDEAATRYRYDPADPTPGIGGALLSSTAGSVDNRELEARRDVITFTSEALRQPREVIGRPRVRVHVSASEPHFDLIVRLCDVHPGGRSMNVSDGYQRVTPDTYRAGPDGIATIDIRMSPLAHRFGADHRFRLQVASGAHPRVARNLGTEESPFSGTRMVAVDVTVWHGDAHRSTLQLPTV